MSVTILVPTHNRPHTLSKIWQSWLQPGVSGVVIINDGSTLSYTKIFAELRRGCADSGIPVTIVTNDQRQGAPAARNKGLEFVQTPYLVTVDDDITLAPNMVSTLLEKAKNISNSIQGAKVVYLKDHDTEESALETALKGSGDPSSYCSFPEMTICAWYNSPIDLKVPFVTAVACWPTDLFKKGLRYHERYGGNGFREETDPQIQASKEFGTEIYYVPSAICYHLPPRLAYMGKSGQRRGGLLWFEYWAFRNNLHFFQRHGAYFKARYGVTPLAGVLSMLWARVGLPRLLKLVKRKISG